jgi:DNA invertase Pin-like site-specific DNA recombinase
MVLKNRHSFTRAADPRQLIASRTRSEISGHQSDSLDLIDRIDQARSYMPQLGGLLFDTSTSQGRLLVTMLAAIAEFEREAGHAERRPLRPQAKAQ